MLVLAVLAGLLLVTGLAIGAAYNGLVAQRNKVRNAFAQIDVQLKRRYDLIPNLVESAKAYLTHERETLEAVMTARRGAMQAEKRAAHNPTDAAAIQGLAGAEGTLRAALGQLQIAVEAYPELKANETMAQLMEELTTTENKLAFSRQAYNDAVMTYNTTRERFPTLVFAGPFGFAEAQELEATTAAEREAVRVRM